MGSVGAERCGPTPAQTPEDREVWGDGVRTGWRDGQRESWREGRESGVVQSYSFDSYQLEEEEIGKDAPERGVLALSEPGETAALSFYSLQTQIKTVCSCQKHPNRFTPFQQQPGPSVARFKPFLRSTPANGAGAVLF